MVRRSGIADTQPMHGALHPATDAILSELVAQINDALGDDLIGLYAQASSLEKVAILEALGAMETAPAERFLKAELESLDRERQRAAAMALSRHFRKGNLPLFLKLARSQDWSLRNTAARALGELGGEQARSALNELCRDQQQVVARTSQAALERCR